MDPIKISAVKGPDGVHLETFDVAELFEHAGAALSEKRYDDAIAGYEQLLKEFPDDTKSGCPASTTAGSPSRARRTGRRRSSVSRRCTTLAPDASDAKDALFQLGATYAEMGNWPTSATVFAAAARAQGHDRGRQDRGVSPAAASRSSSSRTSTRPSGRSRRRSTTSAASRRRSGCRPTSTWASCKYHLGQIPHERFRAIPLRLPEKQMAKDMDDKARLLLSAQRQYIETIKMGNPQWASASGYQVGSLYEEFYDSFIHAPIPPELMGEGNAEKREVYYEELRKKIRILLEKSLRTHEQNLLMLERLGVQNEWRDKSKLAFAKLQKMLDPSYKFDFADPATAGSQTPAPPPPPTPAAAGRAGRAAPRRPATGEPGARDPKPTERAADRPRAADSVASHGAAG